MKTIEVVKRGLVRMEAEHTAGDAKKKGILRAGNTGGILEDGTTVGSCPRLAYLRTIGVANQAPEWSREFMFGAGRANEDLWVENLVAGGIPKETILREEEIPVRWALHTGQEVSGRPDIVIGEWRSIDAAQHFVPNKVLELKLVCSLWTARDVAIGSKPKISHLLQAIHYGWKLGEQYKGVGSETPIETEIWYTCRSDFAIGWGQREKALWPKPGEEGSEFLEYNDNGGAKKVTPFIVGFGLRVDAVGRVWFRRLDRPGGPGVWVESVVTLQSVEDYFEAAGALLKDGVEELPQRPSALDAVGERMNYSPCTYCPLAPVCDKREQEGKTVWVDEVKRWVASLPDTGTLPIGEEIKEEVLKEVEKDSDK